MGERQRDRECELASELLAEMANQPDVGGDGNWPLKQEGVSASVKVRVLRIRN